MEVAGPEVVVIQTYGIQRNATDVHSKFNVVVPSGMAPIVVDLIRILGQQERSGVNAKICIILCESVDGKGGKTTVESEVAGIHTGNAQLGSQRLVETRLKLIEVETEPTEAEVGKPFRRKCVVAACRQTVILASISTSKTVGA